MRSDLPTSRSRGDACFNRIAYQLHLDVRLWVEDPIVVKASRWYFEMSFGFLSKYSQGCSLHRPQFAGSCRRALDDGNLGATQEVLNTGNHAPVDWLFNSDGRGSSYISPGEANGGNPE